jgi:transcriptional regulator with XRE-family HTH domain
MSGFNGEFRGSWQEVLAHKLRKCREELGVSQSELAEMSGLQPAAISHFECGRRVPSLQNFCVLIEALEVNADYILP